MERAKSTSYLTNNNSTLANINNTELNRLSLYSKASK